MLIAYNARAISLIVLIIAGFKYQGQPDDRHASYLRIAALGVIPLLISLLGNNAVGVQRLMLGTGLAVIVSEVAINRLNDSGRANRTRLLKWLPVVVPLGFIYPYASYITYFFGYDRWVMAFAAFIVLYYLLSSRLQPPQRVRIAHLIIGGLGLGMWTWQTIRYVMTFL